jgi:phage terminase large subunit
MFQITTATRRIANLNKRIRVVAGGSSASKTISILLWLIDYAQKNHNETISVVSETFPHLKRGAMRDFMNIMESCGYFKPDRWNKSDYIYTFETDTKLEFFSADQSSKVRGPRRHILFINEANNIEYETFTQLEIRTSNIIFIDFNPVSEFWFYTEMKGKSNVDFITLTYKDNEALDPSIVEAIESRMDNKQWFKVYGEGQLGEVEERIYIGWAMLSDIPHEAKLFRYGLDFGFSNDPAALVAVYQYNGAYIFDQLLYRKGLSNKMLADYIKNLPYALVKSDREPKSVKEISSYGIPIIGAKKGNDSVKFGIKYVQDQKIFVTERSLDLIREYRNYLWEKDTNGRITNIARDFDNHCLDACRYALDDIIEKFIMTSLPKQNTGAYVLEVLRQQHVQPDSYYS